MGWGGLSLLHLIAVFPSKSENTGLLWWLSGKESACQCRQHELNLEDPTGHGAAKPVCHNYCICALEPGSCNC